MPFSLQFVWLVVFTFGAPAFTVLAFSYWRQGRNSSVVFRIFTVLCALSFVGSLASAAVFLDYPVIRLIRALLASLLPPMMAHLVLEQELAPPRRLFWRIVLPLLYVAATMSAIGRESPFSDVFDDSSSVALGASAMFSLGVLLTSQRKRTQAESRQRTWNLCLFTLLLLAAVAPFVSDNLSFGLLPDYLLLVFLAVRLYYAERLVFFDKFLKGGSYFAAGVVLLAFVLLAVPSFRSAFFADWIHAWIEILLLMPVWLAGPLLYHLISRWMDHALDRRYSAIQAERIFTQAVQATADERQLHDVAVAHLHEIFRCPVDIDFTRPLLSVKPEDLVCSIAPAGGIRLSERESQIPFLSADRRLLETLAANLGVVLQNVKLRVLQQEQLRREQELTSLASRAELRALRAQINPHFLFNALNAIAGWIRTEPEFADDTVAQLAEVFRYTLRRSQQEWVRLREELDFIRSYLAVERARFGKRLAVEILADPGGDDVLVPAMIIQPLIENAIKHGVSQCADGGCLRLTIKHEAGTISIEVMDSGPGFPVGFDLENATGHGLRSVADRLRGYFGAAGVLQWENTSMGCRVMIRLPDRGRP
ncbi:MAG: histidine kinase [Bryobacteraceae bacterium]